MPFQYSKVVVIGATSGIGEAMATKMVENNVKVIVVGRRKEKLDAFVEKHGKDMAEAVQFDITQLDNIPKFAEDIMKSHTDVDSIFLNSGVQRAYDFSKPETVDKNMLNDEFTTNYLSFLHLTLAFLPYLQKQSKETSLIYTSSGLGLVPMMRSANYCASKAALHHFILVLREQLKAGPGNVDVVEIYPPAVQTELHDTKHQPDLQNGGQIGMPLKDFVEETWEGLSNGQDQIAVGMAKGFYNGFEQDRQKAFHGMNKHLAEMMSKHVKS